MTSSALDRRQAFAERMYALLPGVYRARDEAGELRVFLALFADELQRIRAGLDRQLADHFIDSCQDWVIPYLADLVGTNVLYADAGRNRTDVKNTIRWRRMKGTVRGLADLAAGVSGCGVHAAEMLERVVWVQSSAHVKPEAHATLDLRDRDAMAAINTPFSRARLTPDLRAFARRADSGVGLARPNRVIVHVWPNPSFPLRGVAPAAAGPRRFRFSALGLDGPLHAGGDKPAACAFGPDADFSAPFADHVPLRVRDVARHPRVYVNVASGFTIREDGVPLCKPDAGMAAAPLASTRPAADFAELATARGLIAADTSLFGAAADFTLHAVRLGAVVRPVGGQPAPVSYSPGLPLAEQLVLRNPHGTLTLDGGTPDFGFLAGVMPYAPASGEFHHSALLLRITNESAAAAAFPESEVIVRSARGAALQIFLPAIASLGAAQALYVFVAEDGGTFFARGDHGAGEPDRNPDSGPYGAFALNHVARAPEAQVRIRPGHPAGAGRTRTASIRSLCCWDKPLEPPIAPGTVAIDPERGRFVFPAGDEPAGSITVDYRYGFVAAIGAGPHDRGLLPAPTLTVASTRNAQHSSVQDAIDAAPDGGTAPVVIEILDSATYVENLTVANRDFPGGLVVQAGALETPVLSKAPGPAPLLAISGSTMPRLVLDGLTCAGGAITAAGAVAEVVLKHATLVPASVTLTLGAGTRRLAVTDSICGPIEAAAAHGSVEITDSILQHPAATIELPQGHAALAAHALDVKIERSTLLGDLDAATAFVSNSLLYGDVLIGEGAASCVRFSRVPRGLHPPRAFRNVNDTPIFVSIRHGDPGYAALHPTTSPRLTSGAEEGGEIGAFYRAGLPWRMQNLALRLAEYTPAGVDSCALAVVPRLAFRGK